MLLCRMFSHIQKYYIFIHYPFRDHAFKLPQRITLSEVRKQAWHAEFLNPEVPLYTFGDKIPHARGADILAFLQDNKVPISRAVWYVRGIGANENVKLALSIMFCWHVNVLLCLARNAQ